MMKKFLLLCAFVIVAISAKSQGPPNSGAVPNTDWVYTYGNTITNTFVTMATASDANQNLYLTGFSWNGTDFDAVTIKLDSSQNVVWTQVFDNGSNDYGSAIFVNQLNGDVYIAGNSDGGTSSEDYLVIRYNASGTQQYVSFWNGSGNGTDKANDIKVDASNYAYVTGTSWESGGSGNNDITTICFKPGGGTSWVQTWDGGSNMDDQGNALVLSSNFNDVYVTGNTTNGGGSTDILALSYSAGTGNLNWTQSINGTANSNDMSKAIILSGANIVLCGQVDNGGTNGMDYTTAKIDGSSGNVIWQQDYDFVSNEIATGIARDSAANIFVTGKVYDTNTEYHTICYDSTGNQIFVNKESTYTNAAYGEPKVAVDSIAHHVYVCGERYRNSNDIFVYQIAPSGNTKWEHYVEGSGLGYDRAVNLTVNGIGVVYLSAITTNTASTYQLTGVKISQTPVYFPPDIVSNERPDLGHLFIENKGQILIENSTNVAEDVLFSCTDIYPATYFGIDKFSYRYAKADTTANDTVQRIDVNHWRANNLTTAYPFSPKHGQLSYFETNLPNPVVGVQGYERYMIPNIYPSIDLHYFSNENGLKMYYVLKPYADPNNIQWEINGATSTTINGTSLEIYGFNGMRAFDQPTVYTVDTTGAAQTVTATATWTYTNGKYKFNISGTYNTSWPLIIQLDYGNTVTAVPSASDNVKYCSYYGGGGDEKFVDMHVDESSGDYVVLGYARQPFSLGAMFPTVAGQTVSTVMSTGSVIAQYLTTVLFSKDAERKAANTYAINNGSLNILSPQKVILQNNKITVIGNTESITGILPIGNQSLTAGAYTTATGPGYLMQFEYVPSGTSGSISKVIWNTRLNGFTSDIDKTPDGKHIYVTSSTIVNPTNTYSVAGAYNYSSLGIDLWNNARWTFQIWKFDSIGGRIWSTLMPWFLNSQGVVIDSRNEFGNNSTLYTGEYRLKCRIACDNYGFYVAGESNISQAATLPNTYTSSVTVSNHWGQTDAFVARFNKKDNIVFGTFVGGFTGDERYNDLAVTSPDEVTLVGYSNSWKRPQSYLTTLPGGTAYVDTTIAPSGTVSTSPFKALISKFDSIGIMKWSTFWGNTTSTVDCIAWGIAKENSERFYVTGKDVGSFVFPASNPANTYSQSAITQTEGFMIGFSNQFNAPIWNTRFGGQRYESGVDLEYNPKKNVMILIGSTNSMPSQNFPIQIDVPPYTAGSWYQDKLNSDPTSTTTDDGYIAHFSVDQVVGIQEYYRDKENMDLFGLFPNPAQNQLNIAFKEALTGIVKIEIYNQLGQLVHIEFRGDIVSHSLFNLNVSGLPNGLYIVNVQNSGNSFSKKLIINR